MNLEHSLKELPAPMRGPRVKRRRLLIGGSAYWGTVQDGATLVLDDAGGCPLRLRVTCRRSFRARSLRCTSRTPHAASRRATSPSPPTHPPASPSFTKPARSLNGHGGQILKPAACQYLNDEGGYAVVIGRACRKITPDEAWDHIEGFCPALDMGLQDVRDTDPGNMLRVKGTDTLLPIGQGTVRGVNLLSRASSPYCPAM